MLRSCRPVLDQNLYYMGANLTSAGFASALINILPAVTFVMALILRMEKVRLRSVHSQAKIVGTLCTVAGAVLMVLYHGPVVQFPWSRGQHHDSAGAGGQGAGWLNGTILIIVACVCWSGFFVLQSNTLQSYPAELSLTTLICMMGSVMSGAVALVAERHNTKAWVIGFDTRLFTAIYAVSRVPAFIMLYAHRLSLTLFTELCARMHVTGHSVFRCGLLRARHRVTATRPGVRHSLQPPVHDRNRRHGLHHTQRRDHSWKVKKRRTIHVYNPMFI